MTVRISIIARACFAVVTLGLAVILLPFCVSSDVDCTQLWNVVMSDSEHDATVNAITTIGGSHCLGEMDQARESRMCALAVSSSVTMQFQAVRILGSGRHECGMLALIDACYQSREADVRTEAVYSLERRGNVEQLLAEKDRILAVESNRRVVRALMSALSRAECLDNETLIRMLRAEDGRALAALDVVIQFNLNDARIKSAVRPLASHEGDIGVLARRVLASIGG